MEEIHIFRKWKYSTSFENLLLFQFYMAVLKQEKYFQQYYNIKAELKIFYNEDLS